MSIVAGGTPDIERIRGRWSWFLAAGIFMAILGVIALGNLIAATLVTTIVLGFVLLVAGATQIAGAITGRSSIGWRILGLVLGVLYLVVGFDILTDPLKGAMTVAFVVALMLIANGLVRVVAAFAEKPRSMWLIVLGGVINILLGLWLATGIPFTAPAVGLFVGIDLLVGGMTWIFLALTVRSTPGGGMPSGMAPA